MSDLSTFVADAKADGIAFLTAALNASESTVVSDIPKLEADAAAAVLDLVPSAARPIVAMFANGQATAIDNLLESGAKTGVAWALARLQAL